MFVYSRTTTIHAPIQAVYEFHLNPHCLRHILPPGYKVLRVEEPARIEVGAEIKLTVQVYGWRQFWAVVWQELQPPTGQPERACVVDEARKSPFPGWRHTHGLAAVLGGTELTDRVEYKMPWGGWGQIVQPLMHQQLDRMFRFRQRRTKLVLEEMMNPNRLTADGTDQHGWFK